MPLVDPHYDFKSVLPLMGNKYFFPVLAFGGRPMRMFDCSDDDDDDDEWDLFFACKMTSFPHYDKLLYWYEMNDIVNNINPSNFDVVSFLSTYKRDYLVRNDNSQVKVPSLREKDWVMICSFVCPVFSYSCLSLELRAVSGTCADLYDSLGGCFELVLVLKMKKDFQGDETAFRHLLSGFPSSCLVVPYSDSDSRNSICRSMGGFDRTGAGNGVLLHRGKVVWHKPLHLFMSYGVDAFSFTDQVIRNVCGEKENESWNSRSLGNLLCCSSSTVLRKNLKSDDETISIRQLQEKPPVGIYLCFNGDLIPILHHIHECCKDAGKTFEIVIVSFPFRTESSDPHLFQKHINRTLEKRSISWWVLPYKRWVSLRLNRLCRSSRSVDELIIVGKGFVDPYCAYVVREFGMRAYPFSKELMFQKEAKRISNVTLASMFVHGEMDYVVRNPFDGGQDKVPVASLVGKNIFVYICRTVEHVITSVCAPLLEYYSAMNNITPIFGI